MSILIKIDAFRFTGKDKHELLWNAHFMINQPQVLEHQEQLFSNPPKNFVLPSFEHNFLTQAYDQLAVLGFHLFHPFQLLKHKITSTMNIKRICNRYLNRDSLMTVEQNPSVTVYGYLITMKATRTSKGEYMYFGTFYDYNFTIFDTVHFPNVAAQYPIRGKGIYRCTGTIQQELGYLSITISKIEKMELLQDPRFVSRYS